MQAQQHADAMQYECCQQHPPCLEDQKQLDRDDHIYDEERVGYTSEHLRPGEPGEKRVLPKIIGQIRTCLLTWKFKLITLANLREIATDSVHSDTVGIRPNRLKKEIG